MRLQPNSAEALANRGVSLQAAGRLEEAIESYVTRITLTYIL